VGQSSYTFWVAVCVAIVIYCENFKFSRNRYRINCLGKKISKNTSTQNSRAGEMLMTIQTVDPSSPRGKLSRLG